MDTITVVLIITNTLAVLVATAGGYFIAMKIAKDERKAELSREMFFSFYRPYRNLVFAPIDEGLVEFLVRDEANRTDILEFLRENDYLATESIQYHAHMLTKVYYLRSGNDDDDAIESLWVTLNDEIFEQYGLLTEELNYNSDEKARNHKNRNQS